MNLIFRMLLALHIIGIIIMAGTTMIDYLTYKTFWKFADTGDHRLFSLIPLMAKYGMFVRTGAITIILTGIILFVWNNGAIWAQPLFRVKMVLVIALILNGLLVGNKQGHKLRETVMAHASGFQEYTTAIREIMTWFYPVQLSLFALIIFISMVRFTS